MLPATHIWHISAAANSWRSKFKASCFSDSNLDKMICEFQLQATGLGNLRIGQTLADASWNLGSNMAVASVHFIFLCKYNWCKKNISTFLPIFCKPLRNPTVLVKYSSE